jgi:hypothetical protein
MYSETPWVTQLVLELAARGLIEDGDPLPSARPDSREGQKVAELFFLLGELCELRPCFSFKGATYPYSEGLDNVLWEYQRQGAFLKAQAAKHGSRLQDSHLEALNRLAGYLTPPSEVPDPDRWRQLICTYAFFVPTPMFRYPSGPWRGRMKADFETYGFTIDEIEAGDRFIAPFESRVYTAPGTFKLGPRTRVSPLAG